MKEISLSLLKCEIFLFSNAYEIKKPVSIKPTGFDQYSMFEYYLTITILLVAV